MGLYSTHPSLGVAGHRACVPAEPHATWIPESSADQLLTRAASGSEWLSRLRGLPAVPGQASETVSSELEAGWTLEP